MVVRERVWQRRMVEGLGMEVRRERGLGGGLYRWGG